MIRPGGGYSGSHYSPAPAAVLPPPNHSSSSSILSPLAPPFVRPVLYPSAPFPQPPPSSRLPSAAAAAAEFSSLTPPVPLPAAGHIRVQRSSSGVVADPYYSHSYPSLPPAGAAGDSFGPPSGYDGMNSGSWSGPFDEEFGQGNGIDPAAPLTMDPSWSYKVPSFGRELAAEGHIIYDDDSHGSWRGKHRSSTAGRVHPVLESPKWLQDKHKAVYGKDVSSSYNVYTAPVLGPSTFLEEVSYSDIPNSNSGFYPATKYATSSHLHPQSNVRASSLMDQSLRNTYPVVHHVSSHKVSEAVNSSGKGTEVNINQYSGSRGANVAKDREDHDFKKGIGASADFEEGLASAEKAAIENSTHFSTELNSRLKRKGLTITIAPASYNYAEPDNSMKSSSEALDQLNLAVDSPCWKGAPASQQPPHPLGKTVAIEASVKDPTVCNDSNQNKKDFENVSNPSATVVQLGTGLLDESKLSPSKMHDSLINLSDLPQKSEDDNKRSDSAMDESVNQFIHGDCHKEHTNEEAEGNKGDSEIPDTSNTLFAQAETTAAFKVVPAVGRDDFETGSSTLSREKRIIKELHRASVDLLYNDYSNGIKLEEKDLKLLRSTLNNILLVLEDSKGFAKNDPYGSRLEAAWSSFTGLKSDGINRSNIACNMKGNMRTLEFNIRSNDIENFISGGGDIDHRQIGVTTQAFGDDLVKALSEREESSEMLYKNLWIESEVEKCKLKYDLQETRMKFVEDESRKHLPKGEGKSALLTTSWSPKSTHGFNGHDTPLKDTEWLWSSISNQGSDGGANFGKNPSESLLAQQLHAKESEDLEASVMARLQILKDRKAKDNSRGIDGKEIGIGSGLHGPLVDVARDAPMKDLPRYLADLGFTESILDPYAKEKHEAWSSNAMLRPDVQPHGAMYSEDFDPGIDASGNADSEEFFFNTSDRSLPYGAKRQGNWFPAGAYRSSSSEWEHVQKDEFA